WNGWPSGLFAMDVSPEEFNQIKRLQINWATRFNGSDSSGLETASTIAGGKITNRRCLGVVRCENPQCKVICRPGTTPAIRDRKLQHPCQEHKFKELVETHFHLGPAALMLGPRRLDGYGKGAADISEATRHSDRVKYERRMVKSRTMAESGHWFLSQFSEWQCKHPGVVRTYQNTSKITVISIQTTWMRDMLVPEIQAQSDIDDALNGLLSDAVHGYWSVGHYLLIVTSVFSDVLAFWVPGLFTVSNGAMAEHYRYHFKGVLESIAEVAESKEISVYDEMFAGVVDFSEPQRIGFENAFVEFWERRKDTRSHQELIAAAKTLLKGCQQHFRNAATRVKRLGGVIPPDQASDFSGLTALLYSTADVKVFNETVAEIRGRFPRTKPWLNWWLRRDHAAMIFPSQRRMDPVIWDVLPDSTNAEEAMHFKIKCLAGSKTYPGLMQHLQNGDLDACKIYSL
ncbi:hypothetical protein ARMGADRAFT_937709, partial [Armillaria gallica]